MLNRVPIVRDISIYEDTLSFLVNRTINTCSLAQDDYDDLMQIGRMAVLKALRRYDFNRGAKESTYVTACVTNALKNEIKHRFRLKNAPFTSDKSMWVVDAITRMSTAARNPLDILIEKEEIQRLLSVCSSRERSIVALRMDSYTVREIANIFNVTSSAVHSALHNLCDHFHKVSLYNVA